MRLTTDLIEELKSKLGRENVMSLPSLEKVVVNVGVGEASDDKKLLNPVLDHLEIVTGQKPVITKARNSVAGFKLREGQPIGAKVTLRGRMMNDFVTRLISVVIPRIRDFRGLERNMDGHGNLTIALKEQSAFPEIPFDKIGNRIRGFSITFVTSSNNDEDGEALLESIGVPFKEKEE